MQSLLDGGQLSDRQVIFSGFNVRLSFLPKIAYAFSIS